MSRAKIMAIAAAASVLSVTQGAPSMPRVPDPPPPPPPENDADRAARWARIDSAAQKRERRAAKRQALTDRERCTGCGRLTPDTELEAPFGTDLWRCMNCLDWSPEKQARARATMAALAAMDDSDAD